MNFIYIFLPLLYGSICLSMNISSRIAIIGGGIGGTSCSYFVRSLFGENAAIDLYEAEIVGGRLSVVRFDERDYEVGGSIIHSRNKYMSSFLDLFKLEKRDHSKHSYFGIYNGNDFVFEESQWQLLSLFRLAVRYQFEVVRLWSHINHMLNNFEKIYKYQENGITFLNVTSLLSAMDPSFAEYLQINSKKGFEKEGFTEKVINELILATLRTNYGQDLNVHKFVGSVSVAGAGGGLWAFHGGNAQVTLNLLQLSGARLIQSAVTSIRRLSTNEMEIISDGKSSRYDIVILAAPQTDDMKHKINFEEFSAEIKFPGRYHQTVCTLIKGTVRQSYFPKKEKYIDNVLSINSSVFFNSLGRIQPVDYRRKSAEVPNVWKIFSQRPLSENELRLLFSEINAKYEKVWLAYPEYDTSARHDSFVLDDNLYHINAIDWAASSMEMSVIGAKNVALLAFQNWKNVRRETVPVQEKNEL